jgi:hypothetical protein
MTDCPECGGEMVYSVLTKKNSCKSCGLTLTQQEIMEAREKNRPNFETAEEQEQNRKKDYLKWYLSSKK